VARATLLSAPAIARLVASELRWDEAECVRQIDNYRQLVRSEFGAAGLML
jgi:hypothetical protein